MKIYFLETNGVDKANVMSVEHSQRAKVWAAHPNAKEISKKEYYDIKYQYEKMKKEVTQ